IELDLMTEAQHDDLPEDEEITSADRLIIDSPTSTGLIVLKALAAEPGLMPQAQASLNAARCGVPTEPPAQAEKPRGKRRRCSPRRTRIRDWIMTTRPASSDALMLQLTVRMT